MRDHSMVVGKLHGESLDAPSYRDMDTWERVRDSATTTINWQFTTEDARIKLRKLYPSIE
jgi:hypothetical protein